MEILKVFKDKHDNVTHIVTNSGSIIEKETALRLAEEGGFLGVEVLRNNDNEEILYNFLSNSVESDFNSFPNLN